MGDKMYNSNDKYPKIVYNTPFQGTVFAWESYAFHIITSVLRNFQ